MKRHHHLGTLVALGLFSVLLGLVILAPWVTLHDPAQQYRDHLLSPPVWQTGGSWAFPLGTDELGRDLWSRLVFGGRISVLIGFASVLAAWGPGVILGLFSAFYPRTWGPAVLRVMDVLLALPGLLLAIAVVSVLGPGLVNTVIAIAVGSLPGAVRITRACAAAEIPKDYVSASRMVGASNLRLMWRTVLPNCAAPLVVGATLSFSAAILEAATLGFLGLGVQPPTPEWGSMLSSARDHVERAPWLVTWPGLFILMTVMSINLLGDGLRDAWDPRLRPSS
ncbi:MAG: hypothetical protein RI949_2480 [Pseudomonadota bacterium]|jgi:dipeptide transport system permease protein|nr:ABC transporter permease subunit [Betaproteobacteria bacterium]